MKLLEFDNIKDFNNYFEYNEKEKFKIQKVRLE